MISKIFKNSQRIVALGRMSAQNFSSKQQGGNLYTWGEQVAGLGYQPKSTTEDIGVPKRIDTFDNNVAKVVMGPNHTAVITTEGDLYTFGTGAALGHGQGNQTLYLPKAVEFFRNNNLKVKDVAVGENHTLAITNNGEVYSWGSGAGNTNFLLNLFLQATGALGQSNNSDRLTPTVIEALRDKSALKHISAGNQFSFAITESGEVIQWGKGKHGVFGDGGHADLAQPTVNEKFAELSHHDHATIKKIQSVADSSVALLSNGKLYAWGGDTQGQLGLNNDIGNEFVDLVPVAQPVVDSHYRGKKVTDFQLSTNLLALLTENNKVYFSGMRNFAVPEELALGTNKKVKSIAATYNSVAVLLEDNTVLSHGVFLPNKDQDLNTGIVTGETKYFDGGEILEIGGPYTTRYAIVKQ